MDPGTRRRSGQRTIQEEPPKSIVSFDIDELISDYADLDKGDFFLFRDSRFPIPDPTGAVIRRSRSQLGCIFQSTHHTPHFRAISIDIIGNLL